jgi:hypothetical protein
VSSPAPTITGGFKGSPLRFRLEKWLWLTLTLAVLVADVFFPAFWQRISILYLAVVSNYALVATFASAEQAAEAKQQSSTPGSR